MDKEIDMKTLAVILLMLVFIVGCPGQVVVPPANIQPALDSIAVLKARIIADEVRMTAAEVRMGAAEARVVALEARPVVTFNGSAADYLNGQGQWKRAVEVITGTSSFVGTAWRKAIYIAGVTPAWSFTVNPRYATESPAIDYVVRTVKTDSLIVIRQLNGTNNLAFDYVGILP